MRSPRGKLSGLSACLIPSTNLNVLAHASGTGPLRLLDAYTLANAFSIGSSAASSVRVAPLGSHLVFQPNPDTFGLNVVACRIADSTGTNSGFASVLVKSVPMVSFAAALVDGTVFTSAPNTNIVGKAWDYDGSIASVKLFVNGLQYGSSTVSTNFSINWSTNTAGFYTFHAVAQDNEGYTNASAPITFRYDPPGGDNLVADITNLSNPAETNTTLVSFSYPVIRDGFFDLAGQVYDSDETNTRDPAVVSYAVFVYRPNDPETPVANVTPGTLNTQGFKPGGDTSGSLGTLNLTALPNGIYDLVLVARSRGQEVYDQVRVSLVNDLKLGAFTFTEQDVVIPVNGIPLTVVRKYDSLNLSEADFGWSWTMSVNDVDASLDEERTPKEVLAFNGMSGNDGSYNEFSLRTGGGRNVMLTMPDGRRVNFLFKPRISLDPEKPVAWAEWASPPGVTATLTLAGVPIGATEIMQANTINFHANGWGNPVWSYGDARTPFEAYDLPGYDLHFKDGTIFELRRTPAFGNGEYVSYYPTGSASPVSVKAYLPDLKLTAIKQKSGDQVAINDAGITHQRASDLNATRSVWFERDERNRVIAIRDPLGQSGSNPTGPDLVRYLYNEDTGNLVQVLRLVDRTGPGTYLTNRYRYDHPRFPHYITAIENARGVPITRNEYDEFGRLVAMIDPAGKTNRFVHDTTNKVQLAYDRTGAATKFVYDGRGNVLQHIDAHGKTNVFTYDDDGDLLTSTDPLGNVTTRSYDTNGNLFTVTLPYPVGADPAKYRTTYTYDSGGRLLTTTLPTGGVVETVYHGTYGLPTIEKAGSTVLLTTEYNTNAQATREFDLFSTNRFGYHATYGTLTKFTNSLNVVTTSDYDANNQLTNLVEGSSPAIKVRFDALGRELAGDYGNGITLTNTYSTDLDWTAVDAPTIGHMERSFDDQGRLSGWKTVNGATPGFAYDDNGRLRFETNSIGVITAYDYDAVGRVTAVANLTTGASTRYAYDAAGRRTQEINALNATNQFAYWPSGSVSNRVDATGTNVWQFTDTASGCANCGNGVTVTDPLGRVTEQVASPYGLPTQSIRRSSAGATGANAVTNTITYLTGVVSPDQEAEEYPATITDEGGRVRSFDYTDLGQLEWASDLGGNKWTNIYDAITGALLSVKSPTQATTSYGYDALENLKNITFADGGTLTNFYDAANRLNGVRLPSGNYLTNTFDTAGRLQTRQIKTSGGSVLETATYGYNLNDAVTTVVDGTGTTTHVYDSAGRLRSITYPTTASVGYDRDLLDRITAITNKASSGGIAFVTRYKYDYLGRITNVVDHWGGNTYLEYDRVGRRTKRTLPSGFVTEWQYDWKDQVTNLVHKTSAGTVRSRVRYERATGGEPTKVLRDDNGSHSYVVLSYDASFRLGSEAHYTGGSNGSGGTLSETITYTYDASGNRTKVVSAAGTFTNAISGGFRVTAVTNSGNGLVVETYGYDTGGRVTSFTRGGATWALGFNGADQLNAVTNNGATWTQYLFDGMGRRVRATDQSGTQCRYLVAPTPESDLESPHLVANSANTLQQAYVFLGDEPLLRFDSTGGNSRVYYLEDGMGSIIGLADQSQNSVAVFLYDGFGQTRSATGTQANPPAGTGGDFRFQGMWLEGASGLYHARARDYDPKTGRFLSRDPDGGSTESPESLHPYNFADCNPHMFSDPTGEFTVVEVNIGQALQYTLQTLRGVSVNEAKSYAIGKATDAFTQALIGQMGGIFPGFDLSKLGQYLSANPLGTGGVFDQAVRFAFCRTIGSIDGLGDQIHSGVRVVNSGPREGDPISAGRNCNGPNQRVLGQRRGASYSIPDFIFGPAPLVPPGGSSGTQRTHFVAEVKSQASTMYGEYISPGRKKKQLNAIITYSSKHTDTHIAVFIVAKNDLVTGVKEKGQFYLLKRIVGAKALWRGVIPVVVKIF